MAKKPHRPNASEFIDALFERVFGNMDEIVIDEEEYYEPRHEWRGQQQRQQQQRRQASQPPPPPPPNPLTITPEENKLYEEIVELGFKESIKKYHPDRPGGDADKTARIVALRDKIRKIAGVAK